MSESSHNYVAWYADVFSHNFDEKWRITVPSEWRGDPFESRLSIVAADENCLRAYPLSWFGKKQAKFDDADLDDNDPERVALRELSSCAQNALIDPQGRIMVKESYRTPAGLTNKEAILVGRSDHFEIWDKKAYGLAQPVRVTVQGALAKMKAAREARATAAQSTTQP